MTALDSLPNPLRVLHVTTSTYPGGAERMLLRTLRAFRDRTSPPRVECRTICIQPLGLIGRTASEEGHSIVSLDRPTPHGLDDWIAWPFLELATLLRIRREIREFAPHVVQGWLPRGCLVARVAAARTGVAMASNLLIAHDPRVWQARLDGWTKRLNDHWIACGQAVAEYHARVAGIPRDRITVVPNALEARELDAPASAATFRTRHGLGPEPIVATAGRLHEQKGMRYLIEGFAQLRRDGVRATLVIAGDGPLREDLERQARELGLGDAALFVGHLAELRDLLASADVFCLPSLYEGLPLVLIEAMGIGTASVATAIPGNDEAIRHEVDGLLVPPRDPAALASAIGRLLADPALRRRFAEAGREHVRSEFLMYRNADRTLEAYAAMLRR